MSLCSLFQADRGRMMRLCRDVNPTGLKKYSYAKLELRSFCMRCSHIRRKWLLVTGLPGSSVLLIHQSATHQCGINQSCACVIIVIVICWPTMFESLRGDANQHLLVQHLQELHIEIFMLINGRTNTKCHNIISMRKKMLKRWTIDYLWKLIWKLAACWGLENLATAFLCWGIILNICNTQKENHKLNTRYRSHPQGGVRVVKRNWLIYWPRQRALWDHTKKISGAALVAASICLCFMFSSQDICTSHYLQLWATATNFM